MELKALGGYGKLQAKHPEVKVKLAILYRTVLDGVAVLYLIYLTSCIWMYIIGVGPDQRGRAHPGGHCSISSYRDITTVAVVL